MWRWSLNYKTGNSQVTVFSTYVEVIPMTAEQLTNYLCILHVCGGDPILEYGWNVSTQYSPRMWRWSCILNRSSDSMNVFSTYVEVILNHWWNLCHWSSILHVCGGDPLFARLATLPVPYSPRMWRWSCSCSKVEAKKEVFSTYVEVIPFGTLYLVKTGSILHVCGGDPKPAG